MEYYQKYERKLVKGEVYGIDKNYRVSIPGSNPWDYARRSFDVDDLTDNGK